MATLQFSLIVDGLSDDSLVVTEFQGQDNFSSVQQTDGTLCHGFRYQIDLASRRPDLTPAMFVDKNAELLVFRDGEVVQRRHGIVRNFTQAQTGHHHTFYALTLVPSIERLSLRYNSRIFQLMSVPDIIATLLNEMGIHDYAFALTRTLKSREFCMQYRETDLEFICRLMAEEGLVYHIEPNPTDSHQGKHTVVFSDDSQVLNKLETPIPYNAIAGGQSETPYINHFRRHTQSQVSEVASGDSSFKKPYYTFSQFSVGDDLDYQFQTRYQHFDAPGRFKDDSTGKTFNQIRLKSLRREAHTASGRSDAAQLMTGVKFDLEGGLDTHFERDWLVIASAHQGKQPQALEEAAGGQPTTYSNQFEAIPADKTWRMPQITRPCVDGPMTAYVVGPAHEEIFCDEMGRVKLHFPWDRYSNGNEHSSCWIQVSQAWAGAQYGQIAIPRIGQQVIVSFLDGDPDQPIVTGRVFNAKQLPPYSLPDNKTKTVWRSETHQGDGFNEISFEDQSSKEQIYLHAQKDFKAEVQNDHITQINHDQHLTIENDQFGHIKGSHHSVIDGESRQHIKGQLSKQVDGSFHQKTDKNHIVTSGQEISLSSGGKFVVEAGAELTLKVGANFVKLDAAGVHIVGSVVNINSGGSAGQASGYSGNVPVLPNGVESVSAPVVPLAVDIRAMMEAEKLNTVAVKPCPLSKENGSEGHINRGNTNAPLKISDDVSSTFILKSDLLKPSERLNRLASGEGTLYKQGSKGADIILIQQALIKLGFDLGTFGADGDFGATTERQVKAFQQNYKPSNNVHSAYSLGQVDGIVGQGTILGLDEAVVGGWKYNKIEEYNWADSDFGILLGQVESKNDYSAYNRTKGGLRSFFNTNITNLKIKDIQFKQNKREIFAVGRFQLIPSTLNDAVKYLNISADSLFNKSVQDYIFNDYLISIKRPQIYDFLQGDGSLEEAMYAWAKEFASAGVKKGRLISKGRVALGGESYYAGDGLNKAHLSVSEMRKSLLNSKLKR